jgi:hypothetical protein
MSIKKQAKAEIENLLIKGALTPAQILENDEYRQLVKIVFKNNNRKAQLRFLENQKHYLKRKLCPENIKPVVPKAMKVDKFLHIKHNTKQEGIASLEVETENTIQEVITENKDGQINLTINNLNKKNTQANLIKDELDRVKHIQGKIDKLVKKEKIQDFTLNENGEQVANLLMSDNVAIVIANATKELLTKYIDPFTGIFKKEASFEEFEKHQKSILALYELFEKHQKIENKDIYRLKNLQELQSEVKKQLVMEQQVIRMKIENDKLQNEISQQKEIKDISERASEDDELNVEELENALIEMVK